MSSTEDGGYSEEFQSKGRPTRRRLQRTSQPLKRRSQRHLKPARIEEAAELDDSNDTQVPNARTEDVSESHVDKANNHSDSIPSKHGAIISDVGYSSSSCKDQKAVVKDERDDTVKSEVEPEETAPVMAVDNKIDTSTDLHTTTLKSNASYGNCKVAGDAKPASHTPHNKHNKGSSGNRSLAAQREVDVANICLNTRRPRSINMTPDVTMKGLCEGIHACDGKSTSDSKKRAANSSPDGSSRKLLRLDDQNPDISSQSNRELSVSVSRSHQFNKDEKCSLLDVLPSGDSSSDEISRPMQECSTQMSNVACAVSDSVDLVTSASKNTGLKSQFTHSKGSAVHLPGNLSEENGLIETSLSTVQSAMCAATKTVSSVYENIINNNHISNKDITKSMSLESAASESPVSKTASLATDSKEIRCVTDQHCLSAEEALLSFGNSQNPPDFLALCNLSPPYSRGLYCNFAAQLAHVNNSNNVACFIPAVVSPSGTEAQQHLITDININSKLPCVPSLANDKISTNSSLSTTVSDVLCASSPSQEADNSSKFHTLSTDKKSCKGSKFAEISSVANSSNVTPVQALHTSAPCTLSSCMELDSSSPTNSDQSQSHLTKTRDSYSQQNSSVCPTSKIAVVHPSLQSFSVGGSKSQFFTPSHMTVPSPTVAGHHSCSPVAPAIGGGHASTQPPFFNMLSPAPLLNVLSPQAFDSKTSISSSFCAPMISASSVDCRTAAATSQHHESHKVVSTNSSLPIQSSSSFVTTGGVLAEATMNLNSASDSPVSSVNACQLPLSTAASISSTAVQRARNVGTGALPKRNECKFFNPDLSLPLGPSLKKLRDQQALDSRANVKFLVDNNKRSASTDCNRRLNNLVSLSSPASARAVSTRGNTPCQPTTRIPMATINSHFICSLCNGYFVNATTIVVCFHSFCRACIVRYLEHSVFCPVCEVLLHSFTPTSKLRPDPQLQGLLYAILPELYYDELLRRRAFYLSRGTSIEASAGTVAAVRTPQVPVQALPAPLPAPLFTALQASVPAPHSASLNASSQSPLLPAAGTPPQSPLNPATGLGSCGDPVSVLEDKEAGEWGCEAGHELRPLSSVVARLICSSDLLCVELINCHSLQTQKPRYFQCPAMVTVTIMERLLRAKFSLTQDESVVLLVPDLMQMRKIKSSANGDVSPGRFEAASELIVPTTPCNLGPESKSLSSSMEKEMVKATSKVNGKANVVSGAENQRPTDVGVAEGLLSSISARCETTKTSFSDQTKSGVITSLSKGVLHEDVARSQSLVQAASENSQDLQPPAEGYNTLMPVPCRAETWHAAPSLALKIKENNIPREHSAAVCESSPLHCQGILLLDLETMRDVAYLQNWRKEKPIKIFYKIIHHSKKRHGSESSDVIDRKELLSIPYELINSAGSPTSVGFEANTYTSSTTSSDRQVHIPISSASDFSNESSILGEYNCKPPVTASEPLEHLTPGITQSVASVKPIVTSGVAILPKPDSEKTVLPEDCLQKWRNVQAQQLQKLERVVTSSSPKPKGSACPLSHYKAEAKTKVSSSSKTTKLSSQRSRSRNLPGGGKEGKKSGDVIGAAPSITSIARGTSGSIYSQSLNGVTMRSAPTNASLNAATGDGSAGLVISALSHQQLLLLQDQQQLAQFQQLSQVQHLYSFQRLQQQPLSQGFAVDDGSPNCISQKSLLASSILPAINSDSKPSNSLLPSSDVSNLLTSGIGGSHLNLAGLATDPTGLFFAAGGVSNNVLNTLSGGSIASPTLNMNAFTPFNLGYGIMPLVSTPNVISNSGGFTLLNSSGNLQAIVSGSGQSLDAGNSLAHPTLLATDGTGFMNISTSAITPDISGLALQGATILPFGIPFGQSAGNLFCFGTNTSATTQNNDTLSPLTIVPVSSEADGASDCRTKVSSLAEHPLSGSAMTLEDCLNIAGVTSVVDPTSPNRETESIASVTPASLASPYASTSSSNCASSSDSSALPYSVQPAIQYLDKPVSTTLEPVSLEMKSSIGIKLCSLSTSTSGASEMSVTACETSQTTSVLSESEWKEVQLKISETGIMSVSAGDDQTSVMESLLDQVESESSQLLLSSIESTPCSTTLSGEPTPVASSQTQVVMSAEPALAVTTNSAEVGGELMLVEKTSSADTLSLVTSSNSLVAQICGSEIAASVVPSANSTCIESRNSANESFSSNRSADSTILTADKEKTRNSICKSGNNDKSLPVSTKAINADKSPKMSSKSIDQDISLTITNESADTEIVCSSPIADTVRSPVKSSNSNSAILMGVETGKVTSNSTRTEKPSTVCSLIRPVVSKPVSTSQTSVIATSEKSEIHGSLKLKDSVQEALPLNSSVESSSSTTMVLDLEARLLCKDSKEIESSSGDVQSDDELPPLKVCESVKRHSSEDVAESSKKVKLEATSLPSAVSTASPLSSPVLNKEERPVLNRKTSKLKEIAEKQRSLTTKSNDCYKKDTRFGEKSVGGASDGKSRHIPLDVAAATISANLKSLSKLTAKSQLPSTVVAGVPKKLDGKTDNEKLGRKSHSVGYKTLNTSPKGWNPTISKEQFQLGVSNVGLPKTNKFFKARNAPRLLSPSSLSALKASVSSPIVETNAASNSKLKSKKLSPVSKPEMDKSVKAEARNSDEFRKKDLTSSLSSKSASSSISSEASLDTSKNVNTSPKLSHFSPDSRVTSIVDAKEKLVNPSEGSSVLPKTPITPSKVSMKPTLPKPAVSSLSKTPAMLTKPLFSPVSREKKGSKLPTLVASSSATVSTCSSNITSHCEINCVSTSQESKVQSKSDSSPPKSQKNPIIKASDSDVKGLSSSTITSRDKPAAPSETVKSVPSNETASNVRCLRSFHKKLEAAKHVDARVSIKSVVSTLSSKSSSEPSVVDSDIFSNMPYVVQNLTKTKPQIQFSNSSYEPPQTSASVDHKETETSVKDNFACEPLKSAFQSTVSKESDASVKCASSDVSVNFDLTIPTTIITDISPSLDKATEKLATKNSTASVCGVDTASINLRSSSNAVVNSHLFSNDCDSSISNSVTGPATALIIDSVSSGSSDTFLISGSASTVLSSSLVTPIISSGMATSKKTPPSDHSLTACDGSSSIESASSVSQELKHSTKNLANFTNLTDSTNISTTAISSVESSNISTLTASVGVPISPCKTNVSHDTVVVTSSVDCSVNSFISSKDVGTIVKSTSCIISSISCVSVNDESSSGKCQTNSSSKGPSISRKEGTPSAEQLDKEDVSSTKVELKVNKSVPDNNNKQCSVMINSSSSVSTQSTHLMVPSVPLVPVSNRSFANQNISSSNIKAKKLNKNQDLLNSDQTLSSKVRSDSVNALTVAQSTEVSTERPITTYSGVESCSSVSNKITCETAGKKSSLATAVSSNPNTVVTQASNTTTADTTQSSDNPFSHFNPNYYMPYSLYPGSITSHANASYPYLSSSLNYYNQGTPVNSTCDTSTSSTGEQSCRTTDSRLTACSWNDGTYGNLYNTKISQSSSPATSLATQSHNYTHGSSVAQSSISHSQNVSTVANFSSMSVANALEFKSNKSSVSSSSTLPNCAHENSPQATHFSACSLKSSAVSSALSSPPKASLPHVYSPNIPSSHSLSQSSSSGQTSLSNISPRNRASTSYAENSVTQMSSNSYRAAKVDKIHFDTKASSPCSLNLTDASSSASACTKEITKKIAKVNQAVASAKKVPSTTSNKNTPCTAPSLDSHNQMLQNYPMLNSPSYALSNFMSQNAFQQATPNFFDPFSAYGFSRGISSTGQSGSVSLGNNYSDFHNTTNRTSDMASYDYSGGSSTAKTCSDTRSTSQYYPYNAAGYFNSSASSPSTHHDSSNTMNALNAYLSNINNSHSYPGYAMAANFHYLMPNSFPMNMMQSSWNSFQLAKGSGSMSNSLDSSQYGNSSANSYSGFYYNQNMGYPCSSFMGNAGSYNNYPYLPMPPFGHFSTSAQTTAKTTQASQSPSLHTTQVNSPASNKVSQKSASSTSSKTFPPIPSPHGDSRVNSISKVKRQSNSAPGDASSSNSLASCESLLSACASSSFVASTKSRTSCVSASPGLVSLQPRGHAANLKESTVQTVTDVLSSLAQLAPTPFDPKALTPGNNNSKFLPLPASSILSKPTNQNYLSVPQAKKDISNTLKKVSKLNIASKSNEDKSNNLSSNSESISKLSGSPCSKEISEKQEIITSISPVGSKFHPKCTSVPSTSTFVSCSSLSAAKVSKSSNKLSQITEANSTLLSNENSEQTIPASESASISH